MEMSNKTEIQHKQSNEYKLAYEQTRNKTNGNV